MVRAGIKNGLQGVYGIRLKTEKVLAFSVIVAILGSSLKQENSKMATINNAKYIRAFDKAMGCKFSNDSNLPYPVNSTTYFSTFNEPESGGMISVYENDDDMITVEVDKDGEMMVQFQITYDSIPVADLVAVVEALENQYNR